MTETPYAWYTTDKALIALDPTLSSAERERLITELTEKLEREEAAQGIAWVPIWSFEVEATGDGTHELNGDA